MPPSRKRQRSGSFRPTASPTTRAIRRRRSGAKKSMILKRGKSLNCHSFRRMATNIVTDVSAIEYDFAFEAKFSDITGSAEFTSLYDRYMITMVVLKIRIVNNPNSTLMINNNNAAVSTGANWQATNWYPRLFYCPDYDDANTETLTQLKERARTRMCILKPNVYKRIVIRPAVAMLTYATVATSGYSPKWKQWIDMSTTAIPHYGMKFAMECSGIDPLDTQPYKLEIERTYYFKCKDVR